jgi:ABC-type transport system involved in multi-copper enzyme maturation permease subunit
MKALAIARRELAAYLRSPVSYGVAALFLLVQGWSFWLYVELLSSRDVPHGAVMRYFFGGTFLFWLFFMFVIAAVTMRLIAEERRSGTLEPLLTAPVHAGEVAVGKYLGALGFFAALWVPTIIYALLLKHYGAAPDPGPVFAGYVGTLLVGASALAIGLAASSLTSSQLLSAAVAFVTLSALLMVGAVGDTLARQSRVLAHINLFRHMEDFGRGVIDSRPIVYHLSLAAVALLGASRLIRRKRGIDVLLAAGIAIIVNVIAARHYVRTDLTRGRTFAISDKTTQVLSSLQKPVDVLVFMIPQGSDASDLFADVRELLERARRVTPNLRIEYLDVDREPERLRTVGKQYGITGDDLASGVIVVTSGGQSRHLLRDDLADFDWRHADEGRAPRMTAWKGEQALLTALLSVTEEQAKNICFTAGHGEPAIDDDEQLGAFAEALRRDHYQVRTLDLSTAKVSAIPADCDLTVVAQPEHAFGKADADELARLLERGGRLLVLMGPNFDAQVTRFEPIGLEDTLERWGASLKNNVVVDEPRLRGTEIAFAVTQGYSDHPITARFAGRRTLWSDVREVRALGRPGIESREILRTSDAGWGESGPGLFKPLPELSFDAATDTKGPVPLGVAISRTEGTGKGARLVVLGSSQIALGRQALGYNRDLLLSTVAWLLGQTPKVSVGPREVEHARLHLDDAQLRSVLIGCVLLMPLGTLALGGLVFFLRRRR